jgi:hypothetical protein
MGQRPNILFPAGPGSNLRICGAAEAVPFQCGVEARLPDYAARSTTPPATNNAASQRR